ncbi:hypothetical protein Asd1617_02907 [Shigella dysenteriae 1617]|uniref:Uncharacterized protein n=1 Tax=Shigella dysenteriae 1617 TaxID=754093 RepID=A0A0A6ZV55_SHIDY|nr:hypothetical protein Asd1617_02907 [Shigella dysenteriae 1617]
MKNTCSTNWKHHHENYTLGCIDYFPDWAAGGDWRI